MSELAAEEVQEFAASAHDVWKYRLEFVNLPAYNPNVTEIALATPGTGAGGDVGAGAVYHLTLNTEVGPHPVVMTITKVVQDAQVDANMVGAMTAHEMFVVTPKDGGHGCVATLTLWLDLPPGVSAEKAAELLAGGRDQIRLELDGMLEQIDGSAAVG
jgi:Polyketide cyclase / dehydrase and lipid transport